MPITTHATHIPAADGYPLAATIFEPASAPTAVVVISAATGIARRFYKTFATFLAEVGFTAITYDYRGIGDSRPASLRGFNARMRDWGELDMAGVFDWATQTYNTERLLHVGHSVGGQVPGLLPNHHKIAAMVTVSSQNGYWRIQANAEKYRVWFFVHLLMPALARLLGYFPWSRLSTGEDLPAGVALEWSRWCRLPDYFFDDPSLASLSHFPAFNAPILAYSFADDHWGTEPAVTTLMAHYTGSRIERRHIIPASLGIKHIGHVGFFQPDSRPLWQETADWLRQQDQSRVNHHPAR
jgi:predicted alpha/beta hydrolase